MTERDTLLANYRPVLKELDVPPFTLMMEHISTKKIAEIPVPITWLLGEETRSEWFRRTHAAVLRVVPNIRTLHITGAGHFTHLDAPEEFTTTVLRALANES